MTPINPNVDMLRSSVIAEFISALILDMRDCPDVLVFLLVQKPDRYEPVIERLAGFKDSYITFSPQTAYGIPFGLCILGFDSTSSLAVSGFFEAIAKTPFDEGGVYVRGRLQLRLLPNEKL